LSKNALNLASSVSRAINRGSDDAGEYGVHADSSAAVFRCRRPRKADHAVLGRDVFAGILDGDLPNDEAVLTMAPPPVASIAITDISDTRKRWSDRP